MFHTVSKCSDAERRSVGVHGFAMDRTHTDPLKPRNSCLFKLEKLRSASEERENIDQEVALLATVPGAIYNCLISLILLVCLLGQVALPMPLDENNRDATRHALGILRRGLLRGTVSCMTHFFSQDGGPAARRALTLV